MDVAGTSVFLVGPRFPQSSRNSPIQQSGQLSESLLRETIVREHACLWEVVSPVSQTWQGVMLQKPASVGSGAHLQHELIVMKGSVCAVVVD